MLIKQHWNCSLSIVAQDFGWLNEAIKQKPKPNKIMEERTVKKINRNRKGYTLVEMVTVIAIIVILGSVMCFGYISIVKNLPWEELGVETPFK